MKKSRKILITFASLILLASVFALLIFQSSMIPRIPYSAPEASHQSWDEILSSSTPITIQTHSTGIMQTDLSGIMNLDHERAADIQEKIVEIPVNVFIILHHEFGDYLIDAGLDSSYANNPHGTIKGILAKKFLGKGSQEPNTHIAAILEQQNIQLKGVWLTHMHPDHIAGVIDLPKNIPYVAGKGERYVNFRFIMQTDHLKGIEALYEIDFSKGIDLPPFGKGVDLFGDGSFWAIESSGHSTGHVMFFINGADEKVLVTGDACNDQNQFDTGIGPGYFSSDIEEAQKMLESIISFKEQYPEVRLLFGHDHDQ
ncbi:MAG: MBL fold metallo-hydrolase [Bacteroidetes bacterium]|nr:MAG: MBL fold metallo-hydrolase [Bacteroidota bacterium]